ncbi:DHS-like NAD/FAD-binding domain-containing protein [Diplogelasinospora grovesii]|uniref:DHS-like NAD/FAD-binding domain-containing protein n=1 Tax=Diplogelasinospora grovesii TaxID=303347 RepID=A0AAN6NHQ6_9PEZI|nr:DHS-like NAD/FAD-binding domain-containing protein [Diplogelasinospora grovesii]
MECLQHPPSSPPSSPLSVLSQSPSLPPTPVLLDVSRRYPSPSSSAATVSGNASPMKLHDMRDATEGIQVRTDGPPAKRRRIAAPRKERTTENMDLENLGEEEEEELRRLLSALRKKKKIVVIAGAGISVSAGIPDFRSSTGLFTTLRGQHKVKASGKHLFDASVYKHDASTESFHKMVRELAHMTSKAKPTPFHHMLASMAAEGRLMRLYSQNVDGIDTQMAPLATTVPLNIKGPWPTTVQLHGGLEKMVCTKCSHLEPFNGSLFEGPEAPLCEKCKEQDQVRTAFAGKRSHGIGRLRPRMVLYNEYNPDEEAIGNVAKADMRRVPDAVIVVGTSLKIPGVRRIVKEMCLLTRSRRDGITAWINIDPEPPGAEFKDCWDFVVRGKCDDIAELVNLPRWDQQDIGESESYMVTGDELREKRCEASLNRDRIAVLLERKRKLLTEDETRSECSTADSQQTLRRTVTSKGIPTPIASPRHRSPLPTAAAKGKRKQSTLVFGSPKVSSRTIKQVGDTAPAPVKGAKGAAAAGSRRKPTTKPRQSKKEAAKPRNTLNQAFKATKAVAAPTAKEEKSAKASTPKKQQVKSEPDSSDLSSPISPIDLGRGGFSFSLPSLRPSSETEKDVKPIMTAMTQRRESAGSFTASPPRTPTLAPRAVQTISPKSKPRSMDHLID